MHGLWQLILFLIYVVPMLIFAVIRELLFGPETIRVKYHRRGEIEPREYPDPGPLWDANEG